MHTVQQIRLLRRSRATRRPLHPPPQRGQREDIRFPLVLVRDPRLPYIHHPALPSHHHLLPPHEGLHDAYALQTSSTRQRRHNSQKKQDGRLVLIVHPRREPRLGHIQRHNERVRQQTEPQLSAPHPWGTRRVTSDPRVGVPHVTDVVAARHGPTRLNCD